MPASVPLRRDFDARHLRKLASRCKDARQSRRLLSLAAVYDGNEPWRGRKDRWRWIAKPMRDWVHRFNEEGRMASPTAIRTRYLSDVQMKELGEIVETGPDPAVDGVVRWRRIDPSRRALASSIPSAGYPDCLANWALHISARPQHPRQDKRIIEAFKKTSPTRSRCI